MWPSTLTIEQFPEIVPGLSLSQTRRWARLGVLQATEREPRSGRHLFHRDEAVVALVALRLQQAVGEKSPLPLAAARDIRPRLAGWLRWEPPHVPGPITMTISSGALSVELIVPEEDLHIVARKLDELSEREDRAAARA